MIVAYALSEDDRPEMTHLTVTLALVPSPKGPGIIFCAIGINLTIAEITLLRPMTMAALWSCNSVQAWSALTHRFCSDGRDGAGDK